MRITVSELKRIIKEEVKLAEQEGKENQKVKKVIDLISKNSSIIAAMKALTQTDLPELIDSVATLNPAEKNLDSGIAKKKALAIK